MRIFSAIFLFVAIVAIVSANRHKNPNYALGRTTMVHLFEWKWEDIANECERFLGPKGFGGVQVSPVTENVLVKNRPWWERYQPISYNLSTRSGNEAQFANMIQRCNKVGVRIYVDVLLNHMSAQQPGETIGTGGSTAYPNNHTYPAVGYNRKHFHYPVCAINDFENPIEARVCELVGLRDLNQTHPYVRQRIIEFMNHLINLGVAGFRVDAARHMWPSDLKYIYSQLKTLNVQQGLPEGSYPYIFQEVIDGKEGRWAREYTPLAAMTEFQFSNHINRVFRNHVSMNHLQSWGTGWAFINSKDALVFVDNHDNQRDGAKDRHILTYHSPRQYRMATAFALAHPYGNVRVISSFAFLPWEKDLGPPQDQNGNLLSPIILPKGQCAGGFVCEHRWPVITKMVEFKNIAGNSSFNDWWDNGFNQIAFCRGDKAFIAINNEFQHDLKGDLLTCLPPGEYCDIISGERYGNICTGTRIVVNALRRAFIYIPFDIEDRMIAIHVGPTSKLD